ncbi:MAG: hypothetical protein ACO1TE_17215 [Prosthecobacter sp.]
MTGTNPSSHYTLLRVICFAVAVLALVMAVTGVVSRASVLAWAVAAMAVTTFGATYCLKN